MNLSVNIDKKSFTIVEFLVVISVIAILLSILHPSIKRTMVVSKRMLCAQHQKEMLKVTHIIAEDQDMLLPRGQRGANNDHTIWISNNTYKKYLSYGLIESHMLCPNISGEEWGLKNGEVYKKGSWVMIWSHYLGNRPLLKKRTRPGNKAMPAWNYVIPMRADEDGHLPLLADGNAYGSAGGGWTLAPHEATEDRALLGYPVTPLDIGAEGGNVGYLNGSVVWKDIADMNEYNVATPQYKGYW